MARLSSQRGIIISRAEIFFLPAKKVNQNNFDGLDGVIERVVDHTNKHRVTQKYPRSILVIASHNIVGIAWYLYGGSGFGDILVNLASSVVPVMCVLFSEVFIV